MTEQNPKSIKIQMEICTVVFVLFMFYLTQDQSADPLDGFTESGSLSSRTPYSIKSHSGYKDLLLNPALI